MSKEIKKLETDVLIDIVRSYNKKEINGFILVEDTITSSDPEDGGADHIAIIQEVSTGKYYRFDYQDWDIDYNEDDISGEVEEVFPKQVITTVYE